MSADAFLLRHRLSLATALLAATCLLTSCGGDSTDSATSPSAEDEQIVVDDAHAFVDSAPPAEVPNPGRRLLFAPDDELAPPSPPANLALRNLAAGDNRCLAVSENNGVYVGVQTCVSGKAAQQWRLVPDGRYFRVRNAWSESQGRDDCLYASSDHAGTVKMGPCAGAEYPTTRLWEGLPDGGGVFPLLNKHWSDLGRGASLQLTDNTVAMRPGLDGPAARWRYDGELPLPQRVVTGERRVLLVAAHWDGVAPAPVEPIRKAVFGDGADYASLAHYVALASRGALRLSGETLADINLGEPPPDCSTSVIRERARAAARARGVDPDRFDYLFVDVPTTRTCGSGGVAGMPGNWVVSWGSGHAYWMWTHEFGHALGARHPDSLKGCPVDGNVVTLDARCVAGGIDDPSDTMGGGGRRMYPVDYQLFAGWLPESAVPLLTAPGTYRLAPLWSDGGRQGYRLRRADGSYLLLEFRRPQRGFDNWSADSPFVTGVIVRIQRYLGSTLRNTLVDTTPGSAAGMQDAPLTPGRSLDDTGAGRRITVLSADAGGAVVRIDPL
jgi:hypothetical protein